MSVMITDLCINCDACIEECPAIAIVSAADSGRDNTYVKPENCIECVDATSPKCADACPAEGAIVWDLAYIVANNDYFLKGHEAGTYTIRTHKTKGLMLPEVKERPFRDHISDAYRQDHEAVDVAEMNKMLLDRM